MGTSPRKRQPTPLLPLLTPTLERRARLVLDDLEDLLELLDLIVLGEDHLFARLGHRRLEVVVVVVVVVGLGFGSGLGLGLGLGSWPSPPR